MHRVDLMASLRTEQHLVAAALGLHAETVPAVSSAESSFIRNVAPACREVVEQLRNAINRRRDPLGDAFASVRSAEERRENGATYTPASIVNTMVNWASSFHRASHGIDPERIVDPGVGSGRFLVAAGRKFPDAELIGVDIDPLAALIARAHLAAAGCGQRARILVADYRELALPPVNGRTLYIGNPPYVRHHLLGARWKRWLTSTANSLGCSWRVLQGKHSRAAQNGRSDAGEEGGHHRRALG